MKSVFTFVLLLSLMSLTAQEETQFTLKLSTDSILMDNYFEVSFVLENASGKNFSPPIFEDFHVVGGPNTSSSMSIVNGAVSQSVTYSYYLKPKDIGSFYIPPASIEIDDKVLETDPVEVSVFPNPDGIQQNSTSKSKSVERYNLFKDDFFQEFNRLFSNPSIPRDTVKQQKKKRVTRKL